MRIMNVIVALAAMCTSGCATIDRALAPGCIEYARAMIETRGEPAEVLPGPRAEMAKFIDLEHGQIVIYIVRYNGSPITDAQLASEQFEFDSYCKWDGTAEVDYTDGEFWRTTRQLKTQGRDAAEPTVVK